MVLPRKLRLSPHFIKAGFPRLLWKLFLHLHPHPHSQRLTKLHIYSSHRKVKSICLTVTTSRALAPTARYDSTLTSYDSLLTWIQGNHYCSRDYGSSASNSNSYHYSNTWVLTDNELHRWLILFRDGSYYYSNPNGSTYHNNGQGGSTYTAPSGNSYSSGSKK